MVHTDFSYNDNLILSGVPNGSGLILNVVGLGSDTGSGFAFNGATPRNIQIVVPANTTVNNVTVYPMVRLSSDTNPDYAPYRQSTLYTVSFGQTIYGGRLIYKNGLWSIEATHNIVDLGSLTWSDTDSNGLHNSSDISDMKNGWYAQNLSGYSCEIFTPKSQTGGWAAMVNGEYGTNQKTLRVKWTDISSGADFKTFVTGKHIVYELATPVIIPITSSTRVKTISGDNNIYSNTGDCELKYFTNKADSLAELIKAFVV